VLVDTPLIKSLINWAFDEGLRVRSVKKLNLNCNAF
jgi:hypothetical protein